MPSPLIHVGCLVLMLLLSVGMSVLSLLGPSLSYHALPLPTVLHDHTLLLWYWESYFGLCVC